MEHTTATLKKQRGLYMLIAVLLVIWFIEPSMNAMASICRDLIGYFYGGQK